LSINLVWNCLFVQMQLAATAKSIESAKILLENAKSYIEDIYLQAKQNDICQFWKDGMDNINIYTNL